jgi:hypothetical protein
MFQSSDDTSLYQLKKHYPEIYESNAKRAISYQFKQIIKAMLIRQIY